MSPLVILWLVPVVPASVYFTIMTFRQPRDGDPLRIQGGNRRTAAAIGLLYGVCWPILALLLALTLIGAWFAAGAPER